MPKDSKYTIDSISRMLIHPKHSDFLPNVLFTNGGFHALNNLIGFFQGLEATGQKPVLREYFADALNQLVQWEHDTHLLGWDGSLGCFSWSVWNVPNRRSGNHKIEDKYKLRYHSPLDLKDSTRLSTHLVEFEGMTEMQAKSKASKYIKIGEDLVPYDQTRAFWGGLIFHKSYLDLSKPETIKRNPWSRHT